jgi:hypothetical protein
MGLSGEPLKTKIFRGSLQFLGAALKKTKKASPCLLTENNKNHKVLPYHFTQVNLGRAVPRHGAVLKKTEAGYD